METTPEASRRKSEVPRQSEPGLTTTTGRQGEALPSDPDIVAIKQWITRERFSGMEKLAKQAARDAALRSYERFGDSRKAYDAGIAAAAHWLTGQTPYPSGGSR